MNWEFYDISTTIATRQSPPRRSAMIGFESTREFWNRLISNNFRRACRFRFDSPTSFGKRNHSKFWGQPLLFFGCVLGCVRPSIRPSVRPSFRHTRVETMQKCRFYQNYYQYQREHILCRVSGLVLFSFS